MKNTLISYFFITKFRFMFTAEDFWQWFDENKERFYSLENLFDHDLYRELREKVREFHSELSFQIGGIEDDPIRQLTISANGKIENFEKVEELVCQAPIFENWKVIAFKPADGFDIKIRIGNIEFDQKCAALQINYIDVKAEPMTVKEIQMADEFVHLEKYLEYRQNQIKYN